MKDAGKEERMIEKMKRIETELNRLLVGRKEVIRGLICALLSKQHGILFGPPGEAKSMLIELLCRTLDGVTYFKHLLAQDTVPDDLFVSDRDYVEQDLGDGRKRIEITPRGEGMLQQAHIAVLEEIFRCNPATLNALLLLINERKWTLKGRQLDCPLISLFGATNNAPEEDLEAFYDRFMFRFVVGRIKEKSERIRMRQLSYLRRKGDPKGKFDAPKISLTELQQLQQQVVEVEVPETIDEKVEEIIEKLYDQGIVVYGRRDVRLNLVLQAHALLEDRQKVEEEDLLMLQHCLWDEQKDIRKVRDVVLEVANPLALRAQELLDTATEIRDEALGEQDESRKSKLGTEANAKLKNIRTNVVNLLDEAKRAGAPTGKIEDVKDAVERYLRDVVRECLGIEL